MRSASIQLGKAIAANQFIGVILADDARKLVEPGVDESGVVATLGVIGATAVARIPPSVLSRT
jgi:hypothetical protein